MSDPRDAGSVTVLVLGVLALLSALFLGGAGLLQLTARNLARSRLRATQQEALRRDAARVVRLLEEDPTPSCDSPDDPVWEAIERPGSAGRRITLEDVSSRVSPNWVREETIIDLGLLQLGKDPAELERIRGETGLHLNLERAYGELFTEESLATALTVYGYFNVNVSDELALRELARLRGLGAEGVDAFHLKIEQARLAKRRITPESLGAFLGPEEGRLLFPLVNAEPVMNLYFAPVDTLRSLFAVYGVDPEKSETALALRSSRPGWTVEQLPDLFGEPYVETPLADYVGLRTWFWRIVVAEEGRSLSWVVARMPLGSGEPAVFRLIEEALSP